MDLSQGGLSDSRRVLDWSLPLTRSLSVVLSLSAVSLVTALLSIYLSREANGFAIIWLPNALIVGIVWAGGFKKPWLHCLALVLGVSAANLAYGDPPLLALLLGGVNGAEVFVACLAIERVLSFRPPHESSAQYLKFVGAVCVLPALTAGVLGATAVSGVAGGNWLGVFTSWTLGDLVSLLAFTPCFYLAAQAFKARSLPSAIETAKFAVCVTSLVLCLALPLYLAVEAAQIILAAPLLALFALWLRAETLACVTAAFLLLLAVLVFFDRTLFDAGFGLGDSQLAFVLAFGCIVVPGNLIASVIALIRVAEFQAREVSQMKSEFLSTMSHEIRTPLNAIMGMFQLIERGEVSERQKLQAATGYKASTKLLQLLSDILEMSRLEAHAVELWIRECSLKTLASEWQVMTEGIIAGSEKPIGFKLKLQEMEDDRVWVDDSRLGQVVHNLIDNAVRFSDRGEIGISIELVPAATNSVSNRLEITVSDRGCGITAEQQEVIFDRFRQTDSGIKRKVGGTGLGLAISKDLVGLMNGSLSVESEPGQGTAFTISIPQHAFES